MKEVTPSQRVPVDPWAAASDDGRTSRYTPSAPQTSRRSMGPCGPGVRVGYRCAGAEQREPKSLAQPLHQEKTQPGGRTRKTKPHPSPARHNAAVSRGTETQRSGRTILPPNAIPRAGGSVPSLTAVTDIHREMDAVAAPFISGAGMVFTEDESGASSITVV